MLLIIEILFLVGGLWIIITGKLPSGLFKFLFGKGQYELPSDKTRLFGLLLLSPLPASFLVSVLLSFIFGSNGTGFAIVFEYVYIFATIIISIVIARKIRLPEQAKTDSAQSFTSPTTYKISNYRSRLLVIFGIIVLGFLTIVSFGSLLIVVISSITVGTRLTGNFWSDIFPFILMIAIIGIGLFGMIKLVQALRTKV